MRQWLKKKAPVTEDPSGSLDAAKAFPIPDIDESASSPLALQVFPCLLDIGEALLTNGADVHHVEELLRDMGKAYGAYRMNVLVITAAIIVTMTFPDGTERTLTRRVGEGDIDFHKVAQISTLCNVAKDNLTSPVILRDRLARIVSKPFPGWAAYIGSFLSAGGFAIFFGGSFLDGLVSAILALGLCYSIRHFRSWTPNTMIFNFAVSLAIGIVACCISHFIPQVSTDMVIIGDIMLLIPGIAMTNATRDMLSGDTISGVMRFIESLLWATALALGFTAALWLAGVIGW